MGRAGPPNRVAQPSPRLLSPRVSLGDDDADGVLVEAFEAAFALQILQMTHDRPSPQNDFVGWGFGRRNGELIDRH